MNLSKNKRSKPLVFSVSENGLMSHYYYCPYLECKRLFEQNQL